MAGLRAVPTEIVAPPWLGLGLTLELGEILVELDGEVEAEGLTLALGLILALGDNEALELELGEREALGLPLAELEGLVDKLGLGLLLELGLAEGEADTDELELGLADPDGEVEAEGLTLAEGETLALVELEGDKEAEGLREALVRLVVARPKSFTRTVPVIVNKLEVPIAPATPPLSKVTVLRAWIDQSGLVTGLLFLFCS